MPDQDSLDAIREVLTGTAVSLLGEGNVEIIDFYVKIASDGDEVFIIELLVKTDLEPGLGNELAYQARNALFDLGEERFPMFYNRQPDNGLVS